MLTLSKNVPALILSLLFTLASTLLLTCLYWLIEPYFWNDITRSQPLLIMLTIQLLIMPFDTLVLNELKKAPAR